MNTVMKLETDKMPVQEPAIKEDTSRISLPSGLVGFSDIREAEILYTEEELPFLRLKATGEQSLHFLVVEPAGLIPDYNVEIPDKDLAFLDIQSAEDVLILNIANVQSRQPLHISVNLIAPLVVNRKTLQAKQVVIENCEDYSITHTLFEEPSA